MNRRIEKKLFKHLSQEGVIATCISVGNISFLSFFPDVDASEGRTDIDGVGVHFVIRNLS